MENTPGQSFFLFKPCSWTYRKPLTKGTTISKHRSTLGAYGFRENALCFMKGYLKKRQQRVRVNRKFSTRERIVSGVSQSSIFGPLIFNILNDLFLFVENSDLINYANDKTLYSSGENLEQVGVIKCFYENYVTWLGETSFYVLEWIRRTRHSSTVILMWKTVPRSKFWE